MRRHSVLFNRQFSWVSSRNTRLRGIPADAISWIFETASLTRRIKSSCDAGFGVTVLNQSWAKPFLDEARALHLARYQCALIREVELHCGERSVIMARTVMPLATLRGAQRHLSNLGTRPLGEVIFSYPGLKRLRLDIVCVDSKDWCEDSAKYVSTGKPIWGRRTVYSIAGRHLLVCEYFMPEALSMPSESRKPTFTARIFSQ